MEEQDLLGEVGNSMLNGSMADSGRSVKVFPIVLDFQCSIVTALFEQSVETVMPLIDVIQTLKIVLRVSTELKKFTASFRDL